VAPVNLASLDAFAQLVNQAVVGLQSGRKRRRRKDSQNRWHRFCQQNYHYITIAKLSLYHYSKTITIVPSAVGHSLTSNDAFFNHPTHLPAFLSSSFFIPSSTSLSDGITPFGTSGASDSVQIFLARSTTQSLMDMLSAIVSMLLQIAPKTASKSFTILGFSLLREKRRVEIATL
jgi:hypothetical protein